MGALQVTGQQQPPGLAAAAAQPNSAAPLDIASSLLVEFIENEVSQHLTLVQAATIEGQPAATVPARYPTRWADLRRILQKLAYNVEASDPWKILGFSAYDGPEPTEASLLSRARVGAQLCGLAEKKNVGIGMPH